MCNMTDEEKKSVTDKLESHGYVYEILGNMDIDAIRKDVYDEIKETLEPQTPKVQKSNSKLTIVTGLWNIKRDELTEGWSRSYEHYLEKFTQLLDVDCNMIIFGDAELEVLYSQKEVTKIHNLFKENSHGSRVSFMIKYKRLEQT